MVSTWLRVTFMFAVPCMIGMLSCDRPESRSTDDTEQPKATGERAAPRVVEPTDLAPSVATGSTPTGQRLAVGDKARGFRLRDQNGREQTLENLLEHANVALVFFRSAHW